MFRRLITPLIGTATCMAGYLALRPYGDATGNPTAMAEAFASPRWVASHVLGMVALAQFTRVAWRLDAATGTRLGHATRVTALVGLIGCLPYYGAETFGLHALGREHLAEGLPSFEKLVDGIRNHPVALGLFGTGLLGYAASGTLLALAWQRQDGRPSWAGWPLGVLAALFLPQFYLPAPGRVAYGIVWAAAALALAAAARPSRDAHDAGSSAGRTG